jgi:hypothetical protein
VGERLELVLSETAVVGEALVLELEELAAVILVICDEAPVADSLVL